MRILHFLSRRYLLLCTRNLHDIRKITIELQHLGLMLLQSLLLEPLFRQFCEIDLFMIIYFELFFVNDWFDVFRFSIALDSSKCVFSFQGW